MSHIKQEYIAGATIDTYKIMSNKYKAKGTRAKKTKPTPEDVKQQNELRAQDAFIRKIHASFNLDDLHIVLTFAPNKCPETSQDIKKVFDKFIRKARKEYKTQGKEFKCAGGYGFLPKDGTKEFEQCNFGGGHNESRPHFHLIVNYIDIRIWTKLWKEYGRAMFFPLDSTGNYSNLAKYLVGHTKYNFRHQDSPFKQRWFCTRNLTIPPPEKPKIIKADSWQEYPKPKKGYYIDTDSIRQGVSAVTGYPYQFYRQIKINPRE